MEILIGLIVVYVFLILRVRSKIDKIESRGLIRTKRRR